MWRAGESDTCPELAGPWAKLPGMKAVKKMLVVALSNNFLFNEYPRKMLCAGAQIILVCHKFSTHVCGFLTAYQASVDPQHKEKQWDINHQRELVRQRGFNLVHETTQ